MRYIRAISEYDAGHAAAEAEVLQQSQSQPESFFAHLEDARIRAESDAMRIARQAGLIDTRNRRRQ